MKLKSLLLLSLLTSLSAMAGAGIVRPITVNWDLNRLPNGVYAVKFDPAQVKTTPKGNYIEFEVFSLDLFDAKVVNNIAAGDCIIANDETIEVKTVKKEEDGYISINYGMEGMIDFEPYDKTRYRLSGDDDHATYSSQGTVKLLVPITVGITDNGVDGDPMKTIVVKGSRLGNYLRNSWCNDFFQLNTTITIKNGKIIKLKRNYIP